MLVSNFLWILDTKKLSNWRIKNIIRCLPHQQRQHGNNAHSARQARLRCLVPAPASIAAFPEDTKIII